MTARSVSPVRPPGALRARRARGVVLLSVLLVVALLSALAWQMAGRHSLVIAQARFAFVGDQTLEYALGAEAFARQVLFEEFRVGGPEKDSLLEPWAEAAPPFQLDNGVLEIQVRDLASCFNLNSLAGEEWETNLERFKTLLRNRSVPETLADAWRDWVDIDEDIYGFGAEDGEYLLEEHAHRTANAPAAHVSEFRMLTGMEPEFLEALEGLLCTLPATELAINVNTASAPVLAALDPSLTEAMLEPLVMSERDYSDVSAVVSEFADLGPAVDVLRTRSEYFEVNIRARVDDGQTELSSVLRRDPTSGEITLISRDFGRDFRSLFIVKAESESG